MWFWVRMNRHHASENGDRWRVLIDKVLDSMCSPLFTYASSLFIRHPNLDFAGDLSRVGTSVSGNWILSPRGRRNGDPVMPRGRSVDHSCHWTSFSHTRPTGHHDLKACGWLIRCIFGESIFQPLFSISKNYHLKCTLIKGMHISRWYVARMTGQTLLLATVLSVTSRDRDSNSGEHREAARTPPMNFLMWSVPSIRHACTHLVCAIYIYIYI